MHCIGQTKTSSRQQSQWWTNKTCTCAACSVRRVWEVLGVLVFCYGTSAFCDMTLCNVVVLQYMWLFCFADLTPCSIRRWHLMFRHVTMSSCELTRAGWPACWTCTLLGQAAVAGRTRVCDCTHSTVTACLADQRAQDAYLSTPVCNDGSWKPTDKVISERHQWTPASTVNGSTVWWFEQYVPSDLSQFRF